MSDRATKSGIALEAQKKIHGKYDPQLAQQILEWIADASAQSINTSGDVDNFLATLKNGHVLCK